MWGEGGGGEGVAWGGHIPEEEPGPLCPAGPSCRLPFSVISALGRDCRR